MNTPDLSQDRELVELAEVMREAHLSKMAERGNPVQLYNSEYLAMADAARTHLGSGYTLPAANEANAERLATIVRKVKGLATDGGLNWPAWVREANDYLRALHAAFGEPEKPAPTKSEPAEKPVRDAVSRDEQREYEGLVLQFALASVQSGIDSMDLAVLAADNYLAWRKQSRKKATCRKK